MTFQARPKPFCIFIGCCFQNPYRVRPHSWNGGNRLFRIVHSVCIKQLLHVIIKGKMEVLSKRNSEKKLTGQEHKSWSVQIKTGGFKRLKEEKAQVIVEYILLIVVSTVLAMLLINLVTVDPAKNSPVFKYWENLLKVVGQDIST